MIDSAWFYQQLEQEGRSLRAMARELGLDPSAVSRMLRGERKMSAEEQDGIAAYLGVPLAVVAARRRGEAAGFAEEGQEGYVIGTPREPVAERSDGLVTEKDNEAGLSFYERVRGCMKGTITIMPGTDLTAPTDPEWAKVYDDD
ncbi:helix-turn-helix domain-containing protein [Rhizobium glycinendophyticum]|uniref:Helix-turn-helix transcriptional regulator n=1 Tax=Rhizobium glycinendophyticum TaxID=2589807 RepID=A0A504UEI9_9HYPH|nr:helix-turn-helix transcriptional regulator [Rhizobium glycinendophyticum]TPP11500.1 helix-turn-helix transcriptional regulator [Rhizobium glycinendophyticum]